MTIVDPCAPAPPRCRPVERSLFQPGISTRQSVVCGERYCWLDYCGEGNWKVNSHGTLDRSNWIAGWIITQLTTRGEVPCEQHPLGKRDGGWWMDSFRPTGLQFKSGSKLWSLNWERATNETMMKAKDYATEALQYLLAWGVASRIKIDPRYVSPRVIQLHINVTGPGVAAATIVQGVAMPNAAYLWTEYLPSTSRRAA